MEENVEEKEFLERKSNAECVLTKIKNFLLQHYEPVQDPLNAPLHLTTKEIYTQLKSLYPSDFLTEDLVTEWLHDGGFSFFDFTGTLKFEWLLKKA